MSDELRFLETVGLQGENPGLVSGSIRRPGGGGTIESAFDR